MQKRCTLLLAAAMLILIPLSCFGQLIENIPVRKGSSRHLLFLEDAINKTQLLQLKPGENYEVFLTADDPNCQLSFNLPEGGSDMVLTFEAEGEELLLEIEKDCTEPVDAYISISCTSCYETEARSLASIAVDENYTPNQLVKDVFIGGDCFDLEDQSISFSGDDLSRGYFSNGASSINFEDGIILSTGDIYNSAGPNDLYNAGNAFVAPSTDADLSQMVNNNSLYDVAALEFDFTPTTNQVSFEFVFASEEYCEYVNSPFNDVFGFFISGPGINGPFTNNAENIAVVPNSTDYTAINSVNHLTNSAYYVNNIPSAQHPNIPFALQCTNYPTATDGAAINDLEFDGFTTVMTAMANVQACETYHIKLVIADVGDAYFDSAVFLKANGFSSGESTVVTTEVPGVDSSSNVVYEGCLDGSFVFTRNTNDDLSLPLDVNVVVSPLSTATAGIDYEALPASITIPAGDSIYYLSVLSYADALNEGSESILLELESFCSCANPFATMYIEDALPIVVEPVDLSFCDPDTISINVQVSGGSGLHTYLWETGETTSVISPYVDASSTYSVTVTDLCGSSAVAENNITFTMTPSALISGQYFLCDTNSNAPLQIDFTGTSPWSFVYTIDGVEQPLVAEITANPFILEVNEAGVYALQTISSAHCEGDVQGEAMVEVADMFADAGGFAALDCITKTVILHGSATAGNNLVYNWTTINGNIISGENTLNLLVDQPGSYTLIVTDTSTNCIASDETQVLLNVFSPVAEATLIGPQVLDCTTPSTTLDASTSQPVEGLTFEWTTIDGNIISGDSTMNPVVNAAGQYLLTVISLTNGCTDVDSITIGIHVELPQVVLEPIGNLNCIDSFLTIYANNSSFGTNFEITWATSDGNFIAGTDSLTPLIDQVGTYSLTILDTNNDCQMTDSIVVQEDRMPPVSDAGLPVELNCNNDTWTLDGNGSSTGIPFFYLWTTINGTILNGDNSLNPEINSAGVYTLLVTNNFNGCAALDSVLVTENTNVPNSADVEIFEPLCFGDLGGVAISTVYGGTEPYTHSIDDGQSFSNENVFLNLPYGNISLLIKDAEGCIYEEELFIPEASEVQLELIPEVEINLGDSYQINALTNLAENEIDSIFWTPDESLSCNNCLNPLATPLETTRYKVWLSNENDCPAEAKILLRVRKDRGVYIPNVFSPNGDGNNDLFLIYANQEMITRIPRFQIFNRWGGKVFEVKDAMPNDPAFGWDGRMKGKPSNSAVFIYVAEIEFIDGVKLLYKGDVTILK